MVLPAHTFVRTAKPCLKVREDEMDQRLARVESDYTRSELCGASGKPSRTGLSRADVGTATRTPRVRGHKVHPSEPHGRGV